jgi:hypothetical protein
MTDERACPMCGDGLEGRRGDARYCSAACRAEAWRLDRLLDGKPAGRYEAVRDRLDAYGSRSGARRNTEPK